MYNPPPPQQGYGYNSPYGMQPPPPASSNTLPGAEPGAKTSIGLEGNAAGALAYIGPFNIVFAIIEKDNRFVRFNAFQSLFTGLTLLVIDMLAIVLGFIFTLVFAAAKIPELVVAIWMLIWAVIMIGSVVFLIFIIMAAVKAYQRQMFKIPLVGNWAESVVRKM
ncbi:MAG TPA: hypothetical protein VGC66_07665 [Pyrinomonadaceae bacterium]